ncbi:MAG: SDR family NAD(P)-dependent oxidoreductase [Ilumatobacter sp.]
MDGCLRLELMRTEFVQHQVMLWAALDVLDAGSIRSAVASALERFGSIDVLVNNAGYGAYGPLEATPMETLRRQFDVNVFGLVETIQAVLPAMRSQRSGVIINISSIGGRMAYPLGSLYHGSKWAVEGLSEAVHFELSTLGIRVKLVEPGGVDTDFGGRSFVFTHDPELTDYQPLVDMATAAIDDAEQSGNQQPEEVAKVIFTAATDGTSRLRYISGEGAHELLASRYSADQDEQFVAGMRAQFGI